MSDETTQEEIPTEPPGADRVQRKQFVCRRNNNIVVSEHDTLDEAVSAAQVSARELRQRINIFDNGEVCETFSIMRN